MRGPPGRALRYGQLRTILLLFGGYAACYYCRADLSVATPLLVEELGKQGVTHSEAIVRIGSISSLGVLAYALGKLFLTGLGDYNSVNTAAVPSQCSLSRGSETA